MRSPQTNTSVAPTHQTDALADTEDGNSRAAVAGDVEVPVPHRIGRYVVLRQLGRGGMRVVYAAYDEKLDRKLAVKVLHRTELQSADQRTRVLREAQAMAQVSHPNVVHAYEVGEVDRQVFLAMEYVEGTTLASWQRQEGRSWEDVLRIYLAAGQGLLAAHRVGLVHRDFKPENVLVDKESRPLVADFGLAHAPGRGESSNTPGSIGFRRLIESPLTMTGALVGTPAYMSPEQYRGEPADSRSDQFSFCAALFEGLYKQLPFSGQDLAELSSNTLTGRVQPVPSDTPVPQAIEQALRRGLSVDPTHRFPSMTDLLSALAVDVRHDPSGVPARSRRLQLLVGLSSLAVAVSAVNMLRLVGSLTVVHMLTGASFLFFATSVVWIWMFLRGLLRNSFHRGVALVLLLYLGGFVGMRFLGLLLGLQVHQVVAMELVPMAWMTAIASLLFLPALRPLPFVCAAASITVALFPKLVWISFGLVYPFIGVSYIMSWYRAAGRVGTTSSPSS